MNVLSLFDGISCAAVALQKAWIEVGVYYASEVDKYAEAVSQKNFPNIIRLWDIKKIESVESIDLLIWWSPCQDLSIAKSGRKGLDGERSGLFREYLRLYRKLKPKRFILENVASMPAEAMEQISKEIWFEPIEIDAALVSWQRRRRLFRTNIPGVVKPENRNIFLKDIIQTDEKDFEAFIFQRSHWFNKWWIHIEKSPTITASRREQNNLLTIRIWQIGKWWQGDRIYSTEGKSVCLSANGGGRGAKTWLYLQATQSDEVIRKLTPIECERLQWLPDDYTKWISNTQRYKCCWDAFNVDVVAHILSFIPTNEK